MLRIGLLAVLAAPLVVPQVWAEGKPVRITRTNNQVVEGVSITADDQGNLIVVPEAGGRGAITIKAGDYIKVVSPEPQAVGALQAALEQGQIDRVIAAAPEAWQKNRFLGWGDEIAYFWGMSLLAKGDPAKAKEAFQKGMQPPADRKDQWLLRRGLISSYLAMKQFPQAEKELDSLDAKDPEAAAVVWHTRARLLAEQGKKREAVLQELKVLLMFPEAKDLNLRRESYLTVIKLLKELGDKRAGDFEKQMLEEFRQ